MVDVFEKFVILRVVKVLGFVIMKLFILRMIFDGVVVKGDVMVVVWIVGIVVVKCMGDFILLCYLLGFDVVSVIIMLCEFDWVKILVIIIMLGCIGVEMEVLIVVLVVVLIIYDMCKVVD